MDTEKVVSGSYDNTLKMWCLKTGECTLTLRGHVDRVLCLQFNQHLVVSGSADKTIKVSILLYYFLFPISTYWKIQVWSLQEERCLTTLYGHGDAVTTISLNDNRIVSGSLDNNIKLWDLASGDCLSTLDWKSSEGHTGLINNFYFL